MTARGFRFLLVNCLVVAAAWAQQPAVPGPNAAAATPQAPQDVLGRNTPRGTVVGFLVAARKGQDEIAAQYLNTRLRGKAAADLARQLDVVLNTRLPARLNELSDRPEGSRLLLAPDQDLVGTISGGGGKVDIVLERVDREKTGPIWLFSRKTLDAVPDLFEEINVVPVETLLPAFLVDIRIAQIPLFEWLALLVVLPLLYLLSGLLNRLLGSWAGTLRRRLRRQANLPNPVPLPRPVRLLMLVLIIRWTLSKVSLPLLARQVWSSAATMIAIAAFVWAFILFTDWVENYLHVRAERPIQGGAASIWHLALRMIDLLAIFVGMLVALHHFGVNLTAALAGLGVGGIAIALAAQKTLENVIGGISLILDGAVRQGDLLKQGGTEGLVEDMGLRSTRIRTFDRSVVSIPNGQLANVNIENLSIRDKFWFHPMLSLRYETTAAMMRSIVQGVDDLLTHHAAVERSSARVRFLRFGASSLDVEIFSYVLARDWVHFLEIQQELLLRIMEIVQAAGARMAFQSHMMYLAADPFSDGSQVPMPQRSLPSAKENPASGPDRQQANIF